MNYAHFLQIRVWTVIEHYQLILINKLTYEVQENHQIIGNNFAFILFNINYEIYPTKLHGA